MGEAIVRRLAVGGATVATTARSPASEGQAAELFVQADISTREGVDKVIREVLDHLGGVDILVNNVGGSSAPSGGVLALGDEDWQHTDTNLFAAVRLDRGLLPRMLKQRSGVIIHISSIQRRLPLFEATLAYAAATHDREVSAGESGRSVRADDQREGGVSRRPYDVSVRNGRTKTQRTKGCLRDVAVHGRSDSEAPAPAAASNITKWAR